jgi:hypothetical protein
LENRRENEGRRKEGAYKRNKEKMASRKIDVCGNESFFFANYKNLLAAKKGVSFLYSFTLLHTFSYLLYIHKYSAGKIYHYTPKKM